jgi:D-serine deaminase-like pyridoxal phosphate-dependent protein
MWPTSLSGTELAGNQSMPPGHVSELDTPVLLIDESSFEHNIAAAESMLEGSGKWLRPHLKTHGVPSLARRQLGKTTRGVTCSTIAEAEGAVRWGIDDVLVANQIVTPSKIERLVSLAKQAHVVMIFDALEPLELVSSAATRLHVSLGGLVDIDVSLGRCGTKTLEEALVLSHAIANAPGIDFLGIMGYEGRFRAALPDRSQRIEAAFERIADVKNAIESSGLPVEIVTSSGTSTMREAIEHPAITDIQAGTYVLMEPDLEGLGLPFRCALSVLTTVISRSGKRTVVDAGRRAIGCDYGPPVPLDPAATTVKVTDDHTILDWEGDPPPLGSKVEMRPSQNRTTFMLNRRAWLVRPDGSTELHSAFAADASP